MPTTELIELAKEFELKFKENIEIGWMIRDEHAPLLRRCIRENDPTPLHEMLDQQASDVSENSILL